MKTWTDYLSRTHRGPFKQFPDWVYNKRKISRILRSAFPKLKSNPRQRYRANSWARIINLYWRMNYSYGEISRQLRQSPNAIHCKIRNIRNVASGYTAGHKIIRGAPKGRPKKISEVL